MKRLWFQLKLPFIFFTSLSFWDLLQSTISFPFDNCFVLYVFVIWLRSMKIWIYLMNFIRSLLTRLIISVKFLIFFFHLVIILKLILVWMIESTIEWINDWVNKYYVCESIVITIFFCHYVNVTCFCNQWCFNDCSSTSYLCIENICITGHMNICYNFI